MANNVTLDTDSIVRGQTSARLTLPKVPFFEHFINHPSYATTPAKLAELLRQAELGIGRHQYEFFSDILDKEPTILSAFETRAHAVLNKSWDIVPLEGAGRPGKKQAEWMKQVMDNLSQANNYLAGAGGAEYLTFNDLMRFLLSAIPYGFASVQPEWDTKEWVIRAVKAVEHKHFIWGNPSRRGNSDYNPYELRMRTLDDLANGEPLEPYGHITHIYKARPALPIRFGLMRTLAYWYLFKTFAMKSMLQYAEAHGMPLRLGKFPQGDDVSAGTNKQILQRALRDLGTDAAAVISADTAIEFITPKAESTVHDRLISIVNAEYSKAILGHSATTEATPGKLGKEEQGMAVQQFRIESDARALESTINAQMVNPMAMFRDGKILSYFKIRYEPEEDMEARAKRYTLLKELVQIPKKHIYETFDIPVPTEGEDVTEPTNVDAFAGMAKALAGGSANAHGHRHGGHHLHEGGTGADLPAGADLPESTKQRRARMLRAHKDMMARAEKCAKEAQSIYASLINGVDLKGDIETQVRSNLADFRTDLYALLKKRFEKQGKESVKAMGLPMRAANSGDPDISFDLADSKASEFLDFQAFSVSVIEGEKFSTDLVDRMHQALKDKVEQGKTKREFFEQVLDNAGAGRINQSHLNTIMRTNLATAHNASTLFAFEKNKGSFPGWEFMATVDAATTPECEELNGKYFAHGDNSYWPPIHFNCRSVGSPVPMSEWNENGYTAADANIELAPGFENNAVRDFTAWVKDESKSDTINSLITKHEGE